MLRHTLRHSELRMSENSHEAGDRPPYNSAGNLFWSFDGRQVEMSMLNGPMPRGVLRELLTFFKRKGVERILADRAGTKKLPLAHATPDGHYVMHVQELCDRFMRDGDTDWVPLEDEDATDVQR